ncbi:MAG: hypothetical protein M1828_006452 [Chrysothrix sp. TS-e1954]|nr:MAG: hypothetical protein M1828_006452 [Chrysothrix sp. TS-e1954]
MDDYPRCYADVAQPLIILSGLGNETQQAAASTRFPHRNGPKIEIDVPLVTGPRADTLLANLRDHDARDSSRDADDALRGPESADCSVKVYGRSYVLPCRKASPQASPTDLISDIATPTSPSGAALHSTLSPLSTGSPLYPDGVMTPLWTEKHLEVVPAVFAACFRLGSDPERNTLNDNQLKSQIGNIKTSLEASKYRTRFVVILLGDEASPLDISEINDRIDNIARASKLDTKTSIFYLPATSSHVEIKTFADSVISIMRSTALDYYRDLSRHARRKREKNTSSSLLASKPEGSVLRQAWIARYEYKLGLFAEFRLEMEVAERHYSLASRAVFDPDGLFATTDSWSRRWDELRLFSDSVAIRQIRCLLSQKAPTSAVKVWRTHQLRIQDLLNRKAKGTQNYGWMVWQSRWASIMAALVSQCTSRGHSTSQGAFTAVEKFATEEDTIMPWNHLHHAGYWYTLSSKLTCLRRDLALRIPEEDRAPPGQSPASQVARRGENYDLYLCLEPHLEFESAKLPSGAHSKQISSDLELAVQVYTDRGQMRLAHQRQLDLCDEYIRAEDFKAAVDTLKSIWSSTTWRYENWLQVVRRLNFALHSCALRLSDDEMAVATLWELSSSEIEPFESVDYNLARLIEQRGSDCDSSAKSIELSSNDVLSPVILSLNFLGDEGHAGELTQAQVTVQTNMNAAATRLSCSSLLIRLEGSLKTIVIKHKAMTERLEDHTVSIEELDLEEILTTHMSDGQAQLEAHADLRLSRGQTKVFNLSFVVRQPGDLTALTAVLMIEGRPIGLSYTEYLQTLHPACHWWQECAKGPTKTITREDTTKITILPKPPKVWIDASTVRAVYYTNELAKIDFELVNDEDEATAVKIEVQMISGPQEAPQLQWIDEQTARKIQPEQFQWDKTSSGDQAEALIASDLGEVAAADSRQRSFIALIPSTPLEMILEIRALYYVMSEPKTLLKKTFSSELAVVQPLEANYDVHADLHPDPWPSMFEMATISDTSETRDGSFAQGIKTRWRLNATLASFAQEELILDEVDLKVESASNANINISHAEHNPSGISPSEHQQWSFMIDAQSSDIDEGKTVKLETTLNVSWRRHDSEDSAFRLSLPVPMLSLPTNEPRVIAVRKPSDDANAVVLAIMVENPSMHSLTFSLEMEPSDDFAFSGPKLTTLQLVPLSRRELLYLLIPFVRGAFIKPVLKVTDTYFNKILRVLPTGELQAEDSGLAIWIDTDD